MFDNFENLMSFVHESLLYVKGFHFFGEIYLIFTTILIWWCGCSSFLLRKRSTPQPVDRGGEKMELPPRLGFGTIYIAHLIGRIDLIARVWVQSLGTILRRC